MAGGLGDELLHRFLSSFELMKNTYLETRRDTIWPHIPTRTKNTRSYPYSILVAIQTNCFPAPPHSLRLSFLHELILSKHMEVTTWSSENNLSRVHGCKCNWVTVRLRMMLSLNSMRWPHDPKKRLFWPMVSMPAQQSHCIHYPCMLFTQCSHQLTPDLTTHSHFSGNFWWLL